VEALKGANLGLRFGLELAALASFAFWGATGADGIVAIVLAVATPLVAAAIWGLLVSPKARIRLERPVRFAVELVFFAAAAAALVASDQGGLALALAVLAIASGTLNYSRP
jgi:hypothetical protein